MCCLAVDDSGLFFINGDGNFNGLFKSMQMKVIDKGRQRAEKSEGNLDQKALSVQEML